MKKSNKKTYQTSPRKWNKALKTSKTNRSINYTGTPNISLGSIMDDLNIKDTSMQMALDKYNDLNVKPIDPTPKKGDYDTIQRIDLNPKALSYRTLLRKFGAPEDFIELHIYNSRGDLLDSELNFIDYQLPPLSDSTDGLSNSINVDPLKILKDKGFFSGKFTLVFNIQRRILFNSVKPLFKIKEISPSRKELKVTSDQLKQSDLESAVSRYISSLSNSPFFKDFVLNFREGNINALGINMALKKRDILIKLFKPLNSAVEIGDPCSLVEEITDPLEFKIDLGDIESTDDGIELRGPNYQIDTRLLNSVPSSFKNYNTALEYTLTSSYQNLLNRLEHAEIPEINYGNYTTPSGSIDRHYHFENFVHFGSATERLKNFEYKVKLIELYDNQVANINTIPGATSQSIAVLENKEIINKKKTELLKALDGYERFLYYESGTYSYPKQNQYPPYTLFASTGSEAQTWLGSNEDSNPYYGGQLLSASLYDTQNQNNLLGLIPQHVLEDDKNTQYNLFVNMVGQHFDHIWTHIHHMTKQKASTHQYGVSKNLVYFALKSLGIETFDQFENSNLIEYILGEGSQGNMFYDTPASQSLVTASNDGSTPKDAITKETYKRLYHNVPYLLNNKGTERGIKALMSCYGLPTTILNIKEYGGPVKDKTGYKTFSSEKHTYSLTGDSGTNGYFVKTDWSSSLTPTDSTEKTVTFRIKPYRSDDNYHLFSLSGSSTTTTENHSAGAFDTHLVLNAYTGSLDISSSNDADTYGRLQLFVGDDLKVSTDNFPVYDGDFWNIHIGAVKNSADADGTVHIGAYKSNFLKNIHKHTTSSAIATSPDYYDMVWGRGTQGAHQAYYGGVLDNGQAKYDIVGPLRYSGSFQEINVHSGELLLNDALTKQALEPSMYAGNTISSSFDNIILRLPLGSNNIKESGSLSGSFHPNQHKNYFVSNSISSIMSSQTWEEVVETHHLITPDTVGASMTSEKVRFDEGTIDDNILSPYVKSETSTLDRQAQDFEDLGVFFSPQNEINEDIIYTLGAFRLDDYIGDPRHQTSSDYPDLKEIRDQYFKKYNNTQRYNFWDYTKMVQYIDHTLFKIVEHHVPAKANLKTGLLIEPHYLERNKFSRTLPTTDEYTTMLHDSHQHFRFQIPINANRSITSSYHLRTSSICVSCEVGNEPQYGAQAPIQPVQTTGTPAHYKPYKSSILLGNATKAPLSSIYFRSLQLGKETDY